MNRRGFVTSAAGLLVAPWVVRAENIMRVKPLVTIVRWNPEDGVFTIGDRLLWCGAPIENPGIYYVIDTSGANGTFRIISDGREVFMRAAS